MIEVKKMSKSRFFGFKIFDFDFLVIKDNNSDIREGRWTMHHL